MASASDFAGESPHQALRTGGAREALAAELFDRLWLRYRQRVSYVGAYEQVVQQAGAAFVNDHIAFRTFAWQRPLSGIAGLSRIFEALGYRPAGVYHFQDKHLNATHYQHPNAALPKLFISELKTWELSARGQRLIGRSLESLRPAPAQETLAALASLDDDTAGAEPAVLVGELLRELHELPWDPPAKEDVLELNGESQYAAWVLVHGHNVNHFTSLINSHGVDALSDIERTVAVLRDAGVPMKAEIEGERGSKLRQTATEAVMIDVDVTVDGAPATMPWTYAYFELAERGEVTDAATGQPVRFEGFLGPQATQLFEMTRVRPQ